MSLTSPLYPGQRLSREEFLRRWGVLPDLKRAELIDGLVYMPSPVSADRGSHDTTMIGWLMTYASATPGCKAGNNRTWFMLESAPQPDADLCILPECGGQSGRMDKYCAGAPELVVEVAVSTPGYDLGAKLALYQRAGVREYITVALEARRVIWRERAGDSFSPVPPDPDGILRSRVFPGLWLDPEAALADDGARALAVLRRGIESEEHTAFQSQLNSRKVL
ncbi:MAG: Uma2 family endonuclease [Bryobacteraceae bacterium]|nr:Uma2 family endonuclease [Bryobacteraceae bacterium]